MEDMNTLLQGCLLQGCLLQDIRSMIFLPHVLLLLALPLILLILSHIIHTLRLIPPALLLILRKPDTMNITLPLPQTAG